MGWRFRQSFKIIPGVRLNLAKTGLSLSVGGAPLTLNVGRRGVYGTASIPGTGIQFRQRLDSGSGLPRSPSSLPPFDPAGSLPSPEALPPVQEIRSASTELLTSEGLKELKQLLQTTYEEHESISRDLTIASAEDVRASKRYSSWNNGFLFKKIFKGAFERRKLQVETTSAKKQELEEQLRLTTIAAQIDIGTEQAELFFQMRDQFARLSECTSIWDVKSQRSTDRVRERTWASTNVSREQVGFSLSSCDLIQWEQKIPHIQNVHGGDLYLYPGFILYRSARTAFSVIDYHDVNLTCVPVRFAENEAVPSDGRIIDQTWAKVNRDGSRDRRFANNYQIPIVAYGSLSLKSDTGLWEQFLISNPERLLAFGDGFKAFVGSFSKQSSQSVKSLLPIRIEESKDIYFSCPNCRKHLVVDATGVGMQISCPDCGATITIPTKVSVLMQNLKPRALNIISEKPKGWEYLLFFQVWADEIDNCSDKIENSEADQNSYRHSAEEFEWLGAASSEFLSMIEELDKLTNVSAPESFGPPGQPGDVEKIVKVSNDLAEVYENMLKWVHQVQRKNFSAPQAKLSAAIQRMASPVIQSIQRFPRESLLKVEDTLARQKQSGQPAKLELTLNVNVDSSECRALVEAAKRSIQQ